MSIEVLKKARDAMRDAAYDEEGYTLNPDLAEAYGDLCQAIAEAEKKAQEFPKRFDTHPQPKREWVGLTEQEETGILLSSKTVYSSMKFTEAKLKEKNT